MAASHALKALPRRAKYFAALCDAAEPTHAATLGFFRQRLRRAGGAVERHGSEVTLTARKKRDFS
jgi:hypothetical protein